MNPTKKFLRYVKINTIADRHSDTTPSSAIQFNLANLLIEEMRTIGIPNLFITEKGYVYGKIPATPGYETAKKIGFIAHMDTSPDFSGKGVNPQIHPNYDGKDVPLGTSGRTLTTKLFPFLSQLKGQTLITTDGTTLLGADDKAGIAEILSACETILKENIPHGAISIGFTPDEEIGRGADFFDVEGFGAELAFTVDGGPEGVINYENFNACSAAFYIQGVNVHPGYAKNVMVNAALVACEINTMLPSGETPAKTEQYEGFYHLSEMEANNEKAVMRYIVRDHSQEIFEARKASLRLIEKLLNEKYGAGTVRLELTESYQNMVNIIRQNFDQVEVVKKAMEIIGMKPVTIPIRGGTDGARLSFMGLPCPNICTGGFGFHGPYEHITEEGLKHCTALIVEIVKQYAKKKEKYAQ